MAFNLILLPRAQNEISGAIHWCERREKGLGEFFLVEVEKELNRIINHLSIFQETDGAHTKFRRAVLNEFLFIRLFTLSGDDIIVPSVFQTHLNPDKKP